MKATEVRRAGACAAGHWPEKFRVLRDMTDRQLLQAYATGKNSLAFGVFVDRHEGAMLSFAAALLRDEALAQDVVQEAFLRAARDPHRLLKRNESSGGERNWMLKVVRDLSVDSLRRKASERRTAEVISLITSRAAPSAEAVAEHQEESERAAAAIEHLKPRLRELLILKVREQKSYKEIAQITGLSVTNVGFLLHQAMQELKDSVR